MISLHLHGKELTDCVAPKASLWLTQCIDNIKGLLWFSIVATPLLYTTNHNISLITFKSSNFVHTL